MVRTHFISLALAGIFTGGVSASPAVASRFDGKWSMVAVTTRGHCGVIPLGLEITHGRIHSTGGSFAFYPIQMAGTVSRNGQVRMKAVAGPRLANGTGRFRTNEAKGTWKGRGPSGLCSGVWNASRF
jgi:hypothetical protein